MLPLKGFNMNKLFVPFLPPWVETGLQPAFYDKESGSVLQQTARMYAKVNQLIRMFNCLSKETKEIVEEYILKFTELKDFVDDYFDNLDVQDEINNKLDEMVEAGTLQEIITAYIQANVAWTFDTVADMQQSTNLVSGSYARTLGFYSINDGGGSLYKIVASTDSHDITINESLGAVVISLDGSVSPKQFGAYGDGTHDDTVALQSAIDKFNYIIIPSGTYMIKAQDDEHKSGSYNHNNVTYNGGLHLRSNLTIEGYGEAVLKAITTDSDNYNIIRGYNVDNVIIKNLTLLGDKDTHTGLNGEYGHCIMLLHCHNIKISNCVVNKAWGDGIYIGLIYGNEISKQNENIIIEKCRLDDDSRNGIAITSADGCIVKECVIKNVTRTAPRAGIDIESESYGVTDAVLNNITVEDSKFYNNFYGIYIYTTDALDNTHESNVAINDCAIYNSTTVSLIIDNKANNTQTINGVYTINNLQIINGGWSGISVLRHYTTLPMLYLNNVFIDKVNQGNKNIDDNPTGWRDGSGIVVTNDTADTNAGNIIINNPYIVDSGTIKYINKAIYIAITQGSGIYVNSPIKLEGLRNSAFFNTIVHDTNEILVDSGTYFSKNINPNTICTIYDFANVSGEAILLLQSENIQYIPDGFEITLRNNRSGGSASRIDLGSDSATRTHVYPFANSNRYISTSAQGDTITIKKKGSDWYAVSYVGSWHN